MAEKRMFAKTIIDSDAFLDMPVTARLLYYDLAMRADDDGFVNSPKKIIRMIGASQDDLTILAMKKFIIPFESGIVVIKHWRIHNYIRKDTYNPTPYVEEKNMLELDQKNAYKLIENNASIQSVDGSSTERIRAVDDTLTQIRLDKNRLDKISIDKYNGDDKSSPVSSQKRFVKPSLDEVKAYCQERGNNIDAEHFIDYYESNGWKVGGKSAMKDWKAAVRNWERRRIDTNNTESYHTPTADEYDFSDWYSKE